MTEQRVSCPYAVSISDDEDNGSTHVEDLLEVAMTSCPAFEAGSCPFRDAKSAEDVRHALLQVPPSHLQEQGHFYKALRHLHHVSQTMDHSNSQQSKFELAGGCPVQSTYSPNASFVTAMEEWSLASIMARMAQDLEDQDYSTNNNKQHVAGEKSPPTPLVAHVSSASRQQVSLSQALKQGTAASHEAAENVHFVRNFIKGSIDRKLYGELVLSLYHVYTSLEEALDQYAPQHFAPCHFPKELSRKEALKEDVDFWHTNGLPEKAKQRAVSGATRDYQERIQYISKTEPLLLLAHAYTRYLGDLSGGKILARVARKAMNLDKQGDGLDFYEFQHIKSAKVFKDKYRSALDELHLTRTQISKLVAEANVAFVLNMRLFEELDVIANIPGASVRDLSEALEFANSASTNEGSSSKECPFAKMSGGVVNPHAIVIGTKRQFPWSILIGLACAMAWSLWQNWT